MSISNPNKYGEIKIEVLHAFEKDIKADLPIEYREYLIKYNGGKPNPDFFHLPDQKGDSRIHHFYGLHRGPNYLRLDVVNKDIPEFLSDNFITIADDPFGNSICLGIKNIYRDKIYYHDHEVVNCDCNDLILLANSFKELVDSLFEWNNQDETDLEKAIKDDDVIYLDILISEGYDIEKMDGYGRTIIENAAINNSQKIIKYIHSKGAKLRNSLKYAEQNAEFFEEHKVTVELIKSLMEI